MASSFRYGLGFGVKGIVVSIDFGYFRVSTSPMFRRDVFGVVYNTGGHNPNRWLTWYAPGFYPTGSTGVFLPLWIPAVLASCAAVFFHRKSRRERDGRCRKCDYDLTGNISGVCPECGTPVPPGVTDKAPVVCGQPHRGE
jgi:hypothetical protein